MTHPHTPPHTWALGREALAELTAFATPPGLSLYQPTHRRHPGNQQDPIRIRHGIEALRASLRQQHSAARTLALPAPFQALADDADFWNPTQDGLGDQLTEPHHTVSSYGGFGGGSSPRHHGQRGKKDEADKDAERFFRAVGRAAVEHHHLFHQVSHYPLLLATGIDATPDALTPDQWRQRAWASVEPRYDAQQMRWADEFGAARARGLGSDNLADVAQAAAAGRVGVLPIEAGRPMAGHLDDRSGRIVAGDLDHPQSDDVLDDPGAPVEKMGGQVHVLPARRMPGTAGGAATFRH
jgi:hypothetical protein